MHLMALGRGMSCADVAPGGEIDAASTSDDDEQRDGAIESRRRRDGARPAKATTKRLLELTPSARTTVRLE